MVAEEWQVIANSEAGSVAAGVAATPRNADECVLSDGLHHRHRSPRVCAS